MGRRLTSENSLVRPTTSSTEDAGSKATRGMSKDMNAMQTVIAGWGAFLSTLLAVIKICEIWKDRHRVDVTYSFTTDEERGNTILVRNLSGRPLILTYWELLYGARSWRPREFQPMQWPDHDFGDIKIEAYSTHSLCFVDEHHFSWHDKFLKGRAIYIRLHFAGRKPVVWLVYPSAE